MQPAKTSETHPLPLASVSPTKSKGRIVFTMCPGKVQPDAITGPWDRDLATDMNALVKAGAKVLLTLMDDAELKSCNLSPAELERACEKRNLRWHQNPIVDFQVPNEDWERRWVAIGADLRNRLNENQTVAIHCRGGRGRAGMIAARLLVELGTDPELAILAARAAEPKAMETEVQEAHVRSCTSHAAI